MADNLLGGLLGYGNRLRSNLRGLLGDPVTYANEALGNALPSVEELAAQARQMGDSGQVPANVDPRIMDLGMGLLGAIKVYHGSPHKFTKASSEHIGKGEGAQAYGHGLYWAESPDVAKNYTKTNPQMEVAGKQFPAYQPGSSMKTPEEYAAKALWIRGDEAGASDALYIAAKHGDDRWPNKSVAEKAMKLIDAGKVKPSETSLYEASLRWPDPAREAADPLGPQHFLDWDKPLSEQPLAIQGVSSRLQEMFPDFATDIRRGSIGGGGIYSMLGNNSRDPVAASKKLKELGIPGITYLDAGSRAAGQGTRNYVTFDDALIELLKRNGISLAGP